MDFKIEQEDRGHTLDAIFKKVNLSFEVKTKIIKLANEKLLNLNEIKVMAYHQEYLQCEFLIALGLNPRDGLWRPIPLHRLADVYEKARNGEFGVDSKWIMQKCIDNWNDSIREETCYMIESSTHSW